MRGARLNHLLWWPDLAAEGCPAACYVDYPSCDFRLAVIVGSNTSEVPLEFPKLMYFNMALAGFFLTHDVQIMA